MRFAYGCIAGVVRSAGLGAAGVDRTGSRLEQCAGLTALVAFAAREGRDPDTVGIKTFQSVRKGLRGKMHLDVVGGEQDLVRLDVDRYMAAGGAAFVACDCRPGFGWGVCVRTVKLPGSPAQGAHQLVRRTQPSQPRRELGDGTFKEIVAVVGGEAGGHGAGEPAQDPDE